MAVNNIFLFLFFSVLCLEITSIAAVRTCRCLPSSNSSCWPHANAWSSFAASLDGHLISVRPPAAPCHSDSYNAHACNIAKRNWTNAFWRADQAGAMQLPNWEEGFSKSGCPIEDSTSTCNQGDVPLYAVDVTSVRDVQKTVEFSKLHNLRLTIKSTGHDFLGRSTAAGSLSIWLHHLKGITVNTENSFVPEGCSVPGITAVTADAGVQWKEMYQAVDAHGFIVIGGSAMTVSAVGGYLQGGGHGPLSRLHGLAADNVVQLTVVTADGKLQVANECKNENLFWALRGGGGGTYGVVISATYKLYEPPSSFGQIIYTAYANSDTAQYDLIKRFIELTPAMDDAGLAGYFYISKRALTVSYLLPGGTVSSASAAFNTFSSFVGKHPGLAVITNSIKSYGTFLEDHESTECQASSTCTDVTGGSAYLASRLVSREMIEESPDKLARVFLKMLSEGGSQIIGHMIAGGAVSKSVNSSVNPAWRQTLWHMIVTKGFSYTTNPEERVNFSKSLTEINKSLREITPEMGSYVNEADYNEPDWKHSFFGDKYYALKAIKDDVDPDGLFVCHHCVGSEDWDEDLNCPSSDNHSKMNSLL